MRSTSFRRLSTTGIAASAAALVFAVAPAYAQTQFGSFTPNVGALYSYDNATGAFNSPGTSVAGNFIFSNVTTSYGGPGSVVSSLFTLTSTTGANVLDPTTSDIGVSNIVLEIRDNTGGSTQGTLLLRMTGTGELRFDTASPNVATFAGDSGGAFVVNFSSDVLNFAGTTQRTFNGALSDLDPDFAAQQNGRPNSFNSGGTIAFASTPLPVSVVPEAGTLGLALAGVPLLGLAAVARRRRSASDN
ncbi:MAG TPA: hypothetical protein VM490_26355 [Armatimonadaceae bacterium]|nr:hypothetical protein [Armatimonadaceae bacterium]